MSIYRIAAEKDFLDLARQSRAMVYASVEWSAAERQSRAVFAEFVRVYQLGYSHLAATFCELPESCPGAAAWYQKMHLPNLAATGNGAVVWLLNGRVMGSIESASVAGIPGMVENTTVFWAGS